MAREPVAQLIGVWHPGGRAPAHRRLEALLTAREGGEAARNDTLGQRNQRLLRLHRSIVGRPLAARVKCAKCGVDNEFTVPVDAILASAAPAPETRVQIESDGTVLSFRLPRMADIQAVGRASSIGEVRRTVLERCRIDGDAAAITDDAAEELAREFEARDPAANIMVDIACASCRRALAASVDVASFVARDLDRTVDALYWEIHLIASAYGWDEDRILSLPAERRRRYVSLIAERGPMRALLSARTR